MANWDSAELLESIRRRARITNSQAVGYTDATLRQIANEALISKVAPKLAAQRASFFRKTYDQTMTVGTSTYTIRTRSLAGVVANFFRVDSTDNSVHPLVEWDEEDLNERDPTKQGTPQAFILQGSDLRLYPVPSKADTLRQVWLRRPNRLVATSAADVALGGIGSPVTTIALQNITAATLGITTSTPVDILRSESPWESVADSITPTAVSTYGLTFAAGDLPQEVSTVAYGGTGKRYYVCLAGQAPVIQLPEEFFAVVAQHAACDLLRPGRDRPTYLDAVEELKRLEEEVYGVTADRVENQPSYLFGGDWPA